MAEALAGMWKTMRGGAGGRQGGRSREELLSVNCIEKATVRRGFICSGFPRHRDSA